MVKVVAPFAGAWIEMLNGAHINSDVVVAPFAGAWIEIGLSPNASRIDLSRSLRGSVD